MSHQHCHDGSCSSGSNHTHSHGSHGKSCSCTDNCCSCCKCGCHSEGCCGHEKGGFAKELLGLADDAWMELLMDKIKDQIEANSGSQLDELAKLVSDANKARWHGKLTTSTSTHDYEEKVNQFFKKGS